MFYIKPPLIESKSRDIQHIWPIIVVAGENVERKYLKNYKHSEIIFNILLQQTKEEIGLSGGVYECKRGDLDFMFSCCRTESCNLVQKTLAPRF